MFKKSPLHCGVAALGMPTLAAGLVMAATAATLR